MNLFQAIVLGIIQGLTEFIPVSSSGHLVLAQYFFGMESSQNITFEVFMHLGTLLAVLIYFRMLIWDLIKSLFCWGNNLGGEVHRKNRMMIIYLGLATLATGFVYILFKDAFESAYANPILVSIMLIFTGIMIFCSDYVSNTATPASNMGFIKSVIIGLAQGLAIFPGISRSGTTLSASLFCNIKRKDAAQFSFLLSIPAILAANVKEYSSLAALDSAILHLYIAGFLASFIAGYLVIAVLIRMIQAANLKYFAFYVWFIAAFSITYILNS
ncbi:MAG: undecaprenyl-diphosphate phosphatase [Candidatus Cloacimonadaceae bacterium]|nr:undecaprenyl-diphosphate phosphatase [Candidatus Cloacimonadota bacterium]